MHKYLDINGTPPALAGLVCEEVIFQQYWYRGDLVTETNVVYLCFEGQWHRHSIDAGCIFWRLQDSPPTDPNERFPADCDYHFKLVDMGERLNLKGVELQGYVMEPIPQGAAVRFFFNNGIELTIKDVNDQGTYEVKPWSQC